MRFIALVQAAWVTVAAVCLVVVGSVGWLVFGLPGQLRRQYKVRVPESGFRYSPESIARFLHKAGPDGLRAYRRQLAWDIVFAAVMAGLLTSALLGLWATHFESGSVWRYLIWVPAIYALFDVIEDVLLIGALSRPAEEGKIAAVSGNRVRVARWATAGKFLSVGVTLALISTGGGWHAIHVQASPSIHRQVVFDYSMPARFGFDVNADGLTDYQHTGAIQERTFTLKLDACATEGSIGTFEWVIDETPDGTIKETSPDCRLMLELPEKTYPVTLNVHWRDGVDGREKKWVTVRDWLIVSVGDSFASGQGAPQVRAGSSARWQESSCARSANAGPAQAALLLEQEDPRSSVTFVHLACSGATISRGLLRPQRPESAGDIGQAQLETLDRLVGRRRIDALVLSIGGNDIRFSGIIERCLLLPWCGTKRLTRKIRQRITDLTSQAGDLASLASCLMGEDDCPLPVESRLPPIEHVLVTAYPNMTQRWKKGSLQDCRYLSISRKEFAWARDRVLNPLNAALKDAWEPRDAIFLSFPTDLWEAHGICAGESWFRDVLGSLQVEAGFKGAFHPNDEGNALGYVPVMIAALHDAGIGSH